MNVMKRIITLTALLFAAFTLSAQSDSTKAFYTMDRIHWLNPWLSTGNMAGMVLNDEIFKNFTAFSDADISAEYTTGNLHNIYDPKSNLNGTFNIDSYSKLGKVFLRGNFSFGYDYGYDSRWRGLLNPYETPFMMADSIPGNTSLEMYKMSAGIGIPLNNGFSLGVDVRYDVGLLAKHRDLRNKNTYMNFDISPSFMYSGKKVKAGLNLGYIRNTEKIDYEQIDQNSDNYLFDLYGLWLYHSTGFSSAETSRMKENTSFYGAAQLDLIFGDFRIFDNFRAEYMDGTQGETGYNNLRHGDTRQMTYSNSLMLQYGLRHRLNAEFATYRMLGDKYLQRQELDPSSNVRIWKSYGGPINCFTRDYTAADISYTYREAISATDIRWEGTMGFKHTSINQKYKEYPYTFHQDLTINEVYLKFAKYWVINRSMVDLTPAVSYSFADGTPDRITNEETGEIITGEEGWQLLLPLAEEYHFWKSCKFSAGMNLRYGYILNREKGLDLNINLHYKIIGATEGLRKNAFRHFAGLSVGLTF